LLFALLLNALRIEAKEGFLLKAEPVVLTDCWGVCRLFVKPLVVADVVESMEAEESPRVWKKKLRSPEFGKYDVAVGESQPEVAAPKPKPGPERPKGTVVEPPLPSSKSGNR
jgi:hypothetical protein